MDVLKILFFGNICGNVFSKPFPDNSTRSGNLISPADDETQDKYILKGGLSKIKTIFDQIRSSSDKSYSYTSHTITCASGNLVAGSPESLFSQGQLPVSILNKMNIDYAVPGMLDFVYGQKIFDHTFNHGRDNNNYCNRENEYTMPSWLDSIKDPIYLNSVNLGLNIVFNNEDGSTTKVLPGYKIHSIYNKNNKDNKNNKNNKARKIDIGIIGLSIRHRPSCHGHSLGVISDPHNYCVNGETNNTKISQSCIDDILINTVRYLKLRMKCEAIILISDFGYEHNIRLADMEQLNDTPINVILSSNSQGKSIVSECKTPINRTLIVETGIYGEAAAVVKMTFDGNNVKGKCLKHSKIQCHIHRVGAYVKDNTRLTKIINDEMNKYFPLDAKLEYPRMHILPNNDHKINISINRNKIFPLKGLSLNPGGTLIRHINPGLHRLNNDNHPHVSDVWEGASSNWMCDSIRIYCKADISFLPIYQFGMCVESNKNLSSHDKCKFGYGNGTLTLADIISSYPFTSYLGYGYMKGSKIVEIIQRNIFTVLHKNIYLHSHEYMFAWSGLKIIINNNIIQKIRNGYYSDFSDIEILVHILSNDYESAGVNAKQYIPINMDRLYKVAGDINPDISNKINSVAVDYPNIRDSLSEHSEVGIQSRSPRLSMINESNINNETINSKLAKYVIRLQNNNNNNNNNMVDNNNYISIPEAIYEYNMSLEIEERSNFISLVHNVNNKTYIIK
uniref:5'-nucleotidase n=1 Tax=Pithovirus LCPAC101 TaxID=2506586 RepID=A0A481Z288_9VIRU|nr:MAG: 5'-nucleotidase [Pithovirus LCPAC101]